MSPTKPIKRPLPKTVAEVEQPTVSEAQVAEAAAVVPTSDNGSIADLNVKMDKLLELAQAIDWKIWIYLKANNYIE